MDGEALVDFGSTIVCRFAGHTVQSETIKTKKPMQPGNRGALMHSSLGEVTVYGARESCRACAVALV